MLHDGVGDPEINGRLEGTWTFITEPTDNIFVVVKVKLKDIGADTVRKLDCIEVLTKIFDIGVKVNEPIAILLLDRLIVSDTVFGDVSIKHWTTTDSCICIPGLI